MIDELRQLVLQFFVIKEINLKLNFVTIVIRNKLKVKFWNNCLRN